MKRSLFKVSDPRSVQPVPTRPMVGIFTHQEDKSCLPLKYGEIEKDSLYCQMTREVIS